MIINKVKDTINKHRLIEKGDKIVLGLSGGPDSVCLLHILKQLEQELDITIFAAHLNHQIRGLEAQRDAMYISNLCDKLGVKFFVKSIDVPQYCKENGLSLEEGARKLRYDMFDEIKNSIRANKIVVAHNLNDQSETILMRLMRGTGLQGLKGIEYKRDVIIRPLLDIERKDIENYCEVNELNPKIDSTNLESVYTRNRIRLELIPYMKKYFNPNIIESLVRMSHIIKDDNDFIENEAIVQYNQIANKDEDSVYINIEKIKKLHISIKNRILRKAISEILGDVNFIEQKHIEDIISLENEDKIDKHINLPRGIIIYRIVNQLIITNKEIKEEEIEFSYKVPTNGFIKIKELNMLVESKIINIDRLKSMRIEKDSKAFDFEKVKGGIIVRNRMPGDKIKISGMGGNKKIKDLFIDLKIPKANRCRIPIISDEQGILCVGDYRVSDDYKIDSNTKEVLKITFKKL